MSIDEKFLDYYSLMCRAVSKPDRLRIISFIGKKRVSVSDIQKKLGISLSSLSNHLNDMYKMGFLGKEKKGKSVFYFLSNPDLIKGISDMQKILKVIFRDRIK